MIFVIWIVIFIIISRSLLAFLLPENAEVPLFHPCHCFPGDPFVAQEFSEAMGPIPVHPECILCGGHGRTIYGGRFELCVAVRIDNNCPFR
jgi:hypothetical protein